MSLLLVNILQNFFRGGLNSGIVSFLVSHRNMGKDGCIFLMVMFIGLYYFLS